MVKSERPRKGGAHAAGTSPREHWKEEPDDHDYPAAADYLSLLLADADVAPLVSALRSAPLVRRKAKDLLRASRLPLLGGHDPHVAEDLAKVRQGERLSPVLVVRGSLESDVAMTIADGYHRICASYHLDENADIPCRLVDAPRTAPPAADGAARRARAATRSSRAFAGDQEPAGEQEPAAGEESPSAG